ncbi:MAG: hypothetical protein FP825_13215 [Hyphomonas sp.]|uniref:hypothetical protein n=1 Tax=Hyphomonas sp. TaxID=87 RepID=UPI00184FDD53|nr:hypothetical protein [Hyphomonas sp.]MBU3919034.1 hypothetical protein [Alphaproteobacteria bacterium]MBA3069425.1 hypothetical protein [Hyphomonas sp.]MBU4063807.1 hypothetical protein [Alphaproteobacteria bacterium]MBU4164232.1 hypothetical protein [Alphaproteobacteria bacterium]MBU4567430.1 hypothetical protein [Alphaproteobacteria bacterium]
MTKPTETPPPEDAAPEAPAPAVPAAEAATPPRPWYVRAFSLSAGQALRLLALSTLAGFFVLAFDYAPGGATFDAGGAFTAIIHRALTALGWAFESFWKPALAGTVIVLPVWAIWRLIRLPFRR